MIGIDPNGVQAASDTLCALPSYAPSAVREAAERALAAAEERRWASVMQEHGPTGTCACHVRAVA